MTDSNSSEDDQLAGSLGQTQGYVGFEQNIEGDQQENNMTLTTEGSRKALLTKLRQKSLEKFANKWEEIIARYSVKAASDNPDFEIDLETGIVYDEHRIATRHDRRIYAALSSTKSTLARSLDPATRTERSLQSDSVGEECDSDVGSFEEKGSDGEEDTIDERDSIGVDNNLEELGIGSESNLDEEDSSDEDVSFEEEGSNDERSSIYEEDSIDGNVRFDEERSNDQESSIYEEDSLDRDVSSDDGGNNCNRWITGQEESTDEEIVTYKDDNSDGSNTFGTYSSRTANKEGLYLDRKDHGACTVIFPDSMSTAVHVDLWESSEGDHYSSRDRESDHEYDGENEGSLASSWQVSASKRSTDPHAATDDVLRGSDTDQMLPTSLLKRQQLESQITRNNAACGDDFVKRVSGRLIPRSQRDSRMLLQDPSATLSLDFSLLWATSDGDLSATSPSEEEESQPTTAQYQLPKKDMSSRGAALLTSLLSTRKRREQSLEPSSHIKRKRHSLFQE
ncbi:hypothetical protein BGZ94_001255 [Podila epigama]|nr:hypothetical protein BGZ94_001255 [Podila epigama]